MNKGSQIAKPMDPSKPDHVFEGWFFDSTFSSGATWPFSINFDVTLYAKWGGSIDYFLAARDSTVNSSQFEYNFTLSVDLAYGSIDGPSAIINGNVKYNPDEINSTYYKCEQTSGLLLSDGTTHTIKTGSDLAVLKARTDGTLFSYDNETVPNDFKYESSSFAKVLFEYTQDQIKSVTLADNGKYEVKYSGSATGIINSSIQILNHPILAQFLDIPSSDSALHVFVTFENDMIDTFDYEFLVSVSGACIYRLT